MYTFSALAVNFGTHSRGGVLSFVAELLELKDMVYV